MSLRISNGRIEGTGTDKDGDFELIGFYQDRKQTLQITRRYSWTTEPSQLGVGIPYDYEGKWDGEIAFGRWHPRSNPYYGDEFEMWPMIEEERFSLTQEIEHREPVLNR